MQAIFITEPGDADVLKIQEIDKPIVKNKQVLIKVAAAGINRPDVLQRQGLYPPPQGASNIPGLEVSGEIVDKGELVDEFSVGDQVCALVTGGGYAQYCLAEVDTCLPVPANLSLLEAGGLPETFFTVWHNVFMRGQLKKGESLLVHGGSSGIGTTAIQMAKAMGAVVITTTSSEEKCQACDKLGADLSINYTQDQFVDHVKQFTANKGVDVILDIVGGAYFSANLNCLTTDGRLVQIAYLKGRFDQIDLAKVMLKRLTITGSTLRSRSDSYKKIIADQLFKHVYPLIEQNLMKPLVYKTFALDQAADAHRLLERNQHVGKIMLTPN